MKLQATSLAVLTSVLLAFGPAPAAVAKAKPAAHHATTRKSAVKSAAKPAPKPAEAAVADPLNPLSDADVKAYQSAFAAAERGDAAGRDAALAKVSSGALKGRVAYAG